MTGSPVHLVKGSDEVLLAEGAHDLIERLLGEAARVEVLDEFTGDEYEMGDVVMASTTVSMFGDRLVVARNAARFGVVELVPLIDYLAEPSPDSVLVVVWDKPVAPGVRANPLPKKLTDAVKAAGGEVHDCGLPGGKGRSMWVDEQLRASPVELEPRARQMLVERLGDDLSRLGGILDVLRASFGAAPVGADDIVPYLGDAGAVPPWDLTDAIDAGDVPAAVVNLQRMLGGGARHPLQVMVTLQNHVERMVRLDCADVRDEKEAAKLLGMKGSTYPAKKALAQSRALGSAKLKRSSLLLAAADLDLRGRTSQDGAAVLEVLVARLAALAGSGRNTRAGRSARTRR